MPAPDNTSTETLNPTDPAVEESDDHGCGDPHCDDHHEMLTPFRRESPKVGRNDPCPCGSGKKHKKCCLGASV